MQSNWKYFLLGIYHLYLQGWRVTQARNQHKQAARRALLSEWRQYIPLECQLTFTRLHSIIFQKIELFKENDVSKIKVSIQNFRKMQVWKNYYSTRWLLNVNYRKRHSRIPQYRKCLRKILKKCFIKILWYLTMNHVLRSISVKLISMYYLASEDGPNMS
jgi:hypothetical protein